MGKLLAYYCLAVGIFCIIGIIGLIIAGQVLSVSFLLFIGVGNICCYTLIKRAEGEKRKKEKLHIIKSI